MVRADTGPFQNIKPPRELIAPMPEYNANTAVVTFRLPDDAIPISELKPEVASGSGNSVIKNFGLQDRQTNNAPGTGIETLAAFIDSAIPSIYFELFCNDLHLGCPTF